MIIPLQGTRARGEMSTLSRGIKIPPNYTWKTCNKWVQLHWKNLVAISSWQWQTEIAGCWHIEEVIILCNTEETGQGWSVTSFWDHIAIFYFPLWISSVLTILCRINDSCQAEGSLSLSVERFDFDLKLCRWRQGGVFVDIVPGLGVSYCHLPPFVLIMRFKGHNVAKVRPIVVLWLYRLLTET